MNWLRVVIAAWALCGIAAAGFEVAYFQGKYKLSAKSEYREDLGHSLMFGLLFGPVALIVSFFAGGFGKYGWRLRNRKTHNV